MELLIYFFVFILGTLIGSFLNVLVLRYGTGRSIVNERSGCFSCGKTLSWFELIPILSFLIQKGRCKNCCSRISMQYITVEILTGLIFLLIFNFQFSIFNQFSKEFILHTLYFWVIFSLLIALSVYDLRHKIIPDGLVFLFIGFSFFGNLLLGILSFKSLLLGGIFICLPLFLLWFISKGLWMGFGDVKLALGIGFFLGLENGIYALVWSFWIGGFFSVILLSLTKISQNLVNRGKLSLISKRFTIKSEIPFGPFLVLGIFTAFFIKWDFLNLELIFNLLS